MGYIDDASGEFFGRFYEYEGTFPALDSFKQFAEEKGLPKSICLDRHSTYKTTRKATVEEELEEKAANTQFERVMNESGVEVIHARSPQAKGRVERVFETLQDRLVKEMRLANIKNITEANKFLIGYLPEFNKKFKKECRSSESLFVSLPKRFDPQWVYAIQDHATIKNDFTIQWQNRLFLIEKPSITMKKQKVRIKQSLDGVLRFDVKTKQLLVKEISEKDLEYLKRQTKKMLKLEKQLPYKKYKKNWMDKLYIGQKDYQLLK